MVPEFLARDDLANGTVMQVLPNWNIYVAGVYAVWPPNVTRAGLTARLVSFLEKRIRSRT